MKTHIYVNEKPIESFRYPGGEAHITLPPLLAPSQRYFFVCAFLYNADDLMKLLLTINAIKRHFRNPVVSLRLPYLPYARQDRPFENGALSLEVMADLINSLECEAVKLYDPHSDVSEALIKNSTSLNWFDIYKQAPFPLQENLIAPDAGARKKVERFVQDLNIPGHRLRVVQALKHRDPSTGNIDSMRLVDSVNGGGALVMDDICDGGRTFIELSKEYVKQIPQFNLTLYVTHGIFSKGLDVLKPYYQHIYCLHTFLEDDQIDKNYLTVLIPKEKIR